MKKNILFFIIIALPVISFAQDGANAKKPSVDGTKEEDKTESSTENIKVDQTEVITKDYVKGEPIELYDLIYMLLPDEGETAEVFAWEKLDDFIVLNLDNEYYNEFSNSYSKRGEAIVTINGKFFKNARGGGSEWDIELEGNKEGWSIFDLEYVYNHSVEFDTDFYYDLNNLFPSINFMSKLIFKESRWSQSLYEVKFPDKRLCWMQIKHDGNKIPAFTLSFFLNEKEVDKDRLY